MKVKSESEVAQSGATLHDPMDCSLPGLSMHGIFQEYWSGFPCSSPDPLVEDMATHSSILAWRIPWTEESGGLQFIGSQRVGHD